ncbi:hypothetical protein BGZ54_008081 [Gamsiella multidivaricata]|nr:hypothetical protein BGZ54_008081 [Gamsiella multidivaricata]
MGKLTNLLRKKKARGDEPTTEEQGKTASNLSGSSSNGSATRLSLSIPTTDINSLDLNMSISLMDDIMDGLAATAPDSPQSSQAEPGPKFSDFGLVAELSRQLDLGASSTDDRNPNSIKPTQNGPPRVGKLEQNSTFKGNAFLRSELLQRSGNTPITTAYKSTAPIRQTISAQGNPSTSNTASIINNTPSYLNKTLLSKLATERAEIATQARDATRKANAQLPSDDEGSETSDSGCSDAGLEAEKQRQLQLQQQQQEQNQGKKESSYCESSSKKQRPINHEAVIGRMKDRHRADLAGAAAAAREGHYGEYMDEYSHMQQIQPQSPMRYGTQYSMDQGMMYGIEEYGLQPQQQQQQQQQQMYLGQNIPLQPHINAQYGPHPSVNPLMAGYPYGPHGPTSTYGLGMQASLYSGRGSFTSLATSTADGYVHNMYNGESPVHSRKGSRQPSTASPRQSEDTCTELSPVPAVSHHQKAAPSDNGYGCMREHDMKPINKDVGYPQELDTGNLNDKAARKNKTNKDDGAKAVTELEISRAEVGADSETSQVNATELKGQLEEPDSNRDNFMTDSINAHKEIADIGTVSSFAANAQGDKDDSIDSDNESSDDDQPIILGRRGSALGPFLSIKTNTGAATSDHPEHPESVLEPPTSSRIPYTMHTKNAYQSQAQGPTSLPSHLPYTSQQQQYIPMGYQLSAPQASTNMGRHHSYSMDRGAPAMLIGPHPTAPGIQSVEGNAPGPMAHTTRRGANLLQSGPKDMRSSNLYPAAPGTAMQSQYPVPSTTLLHPLPRRSQSARPRTQALGPGIIRKESPSRQQQQQQQPQPSTRNRVSVEVVRLSNGGYQAVAGLDYGNPGSGSLRRPFIHGALESLSPTQQQQQMVSPKLAQSMHQKQQQQQQQLQQGYFIGPGHHGFNLHPNDLYSAHLHQQITQFARR